MFLNIGQIILYGALSIIILFVLLFLFFGIVVTIQYNKVFGKRIDNPKYLKYFAVSDYPGLNKQDISFISTHNNKLYGGIYSYQRYKYLGLVIVSHGMGGGHMAYATEINHFAKLGFLVLSYDNTGTAKSEGKKIYGLQQAVLDLDACLKYVKEDENLNKYKILLYGHSMGGYAVSNVTSLNKQISGVVSLAAPNCADDVIPKKFFISFWFHLLEKINFKNNAKLKTIESYKKATMPILVIHGTLDPDVPFMTFEKYQNEVNNDNIHFLAVENKMHRPNISDKAVLYIIKNNHELDGLHIKYGKKIPDDVLKNYYENLDYQLLVEFDNNVMDKVDQFMLKCVKED